MNEEKLIEEKLNEETLNEEKLNASRNSPQLATPEVPKLNSTPKVVPKHYSRTSSEEHEEFQAGVGKTTDFDKNNDHSKNVDDQPKSMVIVTNPSLTSVQAFSMQFSEYFRFKKETNTQRTVQNQQIKKMKKIEKNEKKIEKN